MHAPARRWGGLDEGHVHRAEQAPGDGRLTTAVAGGLDLPEGGLQTRLGAGHRPFEVDVRAGRTQAVRGHDDGDGHDQQHGGGDADDEHEPDAPLVSITPPHASHHGAHPAFRSLLEKVSVRVLVPPEVVAS